MTKKKFIELHGEEAFERIVLPRISRQQQQEPQSLVLANPIALAHDDIKRMLELMGFSYMSGILEAQNRLIDFNRLP